MTRIEELEMEIKLTKELIELQKTFNELRKSNPIPYYPIRPYEQPHNPYVGTPITNPPKVWY